MKKRITTRYYLCGIPAGTRNVRGSSNKFEKKRRKRFTKKKGKKSFKRF